MERFDRELAKRIGKNIQTLRKQAGFKSAESFADEIGMSKDTYTGYEQGRISLSFEKAWIIADALNVTLDELGGRVPPHDDSVIIVTDEKQRILNDCYTKLKPQAKDNVVSLIQSIEYDPRNRESVKDGQGDSDTSAVGA